MIIFLLLPFVFTDYIVQCTLIIEALSGKKKVGGRGRRKEEEGGGGEVIKKIQSQLKENQNHSIFVTKRIE